MIRRCSILGFFALLPPLLAAQLPEKADRVVQYQIRVRLDPESKQLDGQERLTWHNPSPEPVPDLWFHLYLNAFKNTKSTFFVESGGQLRGDRLAEGKWGWTPSCWPPTCFTRQTRWRGSGTTMTRLSCG